MTDTPPPGAVGRDHPPTSHDAAELSAYSNLDHRERALLLLYDAGQRGLTGAELGVELEVSTNIACVRLGELRAEGCNVGKFPRLAYRTSDPNDRRALPGGRPGQVHYLNEDGKAAVGRIRKRLGLDG